VIYTYELNEETGRYTATGIHHDRIAVKVPYDIDIDVTAIDRL
jgi:hypothetical protein